MNLAERTLTIDSNRFSSYGNFFERLQAGSSSLTIRKIFLLLRNIQEYKNWKEINTSILKGQKPRILVLRNGMQFDIPEDNTIFRMIYDIFFRNIYTPPGLPIEANDIVVDVGANIGVFTLFASRKTQKTIHAFEPFLGNVDFLNRNIRLNKLQNVVTHNTAVCDKIGSAKLFLTNTSGGHLLFNHNVTGKLEKYVEVPTTTLQQIMDDNDLRQIDFLKLDCEGSEGSILISTPIEYLKRVGKIAMEFHDNVSALKHDEIQRFLREVGFVVKLNWNGKSPGGYIYAKMPQCARRLREQNIEARR